MVEDAVFLRDRDGFFAGILARLRESLASVGGEPAAWRQYADPFRPPLRAELPEMASISRRLGRERGLSFLWRRAYGDEG